MAVPTIEHSVTHDLLWNDPLCQHCYEELLYLAMSMYVVLCNIVVQLVGDYVILGYHTSSLFNQTDKPG